MKVGDIVRQNNNLIEMKKKNQPHTPSKLVGVVVEIRNQGQPKHQESEWLKCWMDRLGRQVDVLWSNGNLTTNFAENSLDVIKE